MACKITYNGKVFENEAKFMQYFSKNVAQFGHYFLEAGDIKAAAKWVLEDKKAPGKTWEQRRQQARDKFEELGARRKASSADNKLAIMSRNFVEQFFTNEEGKTVRKLVDVNNSLNEDMPDPQILSEKFYPAGTRLTFTVLDDPSIPMYAGVGNRTKTTWGDYKVDQAVPEEEEYLYVPIGVYNEAGKLVAYIHNANWVDESNLSTASRSIDQLFDDLAATREVLFRNKTTSGSISTRLPGAVSFAAPEQDDSRPMVPLKDGFPTATIAVMGAGLSTGQQHLDDIIEAFLGKNKLTLFEGEVLAIEEGPDKVVTYTEARTLNADEADSITEAIRVFVTGEKSDFANEVEATMGIDLTTGDGIEEYLQHFVYLTPLFGIPGNEEYESYDPAIYSSALENKIKAQKIPTGYFFMNLTRNGVNFASSGKGKLSFNISQNIKSEEKREQALRLTRDFLNLMKLNTNAKLLDKTVPVTMLRAGEVKSEMLDYTAFIKESISSRIQGYNIGTEENPEYVYRLNPVILFELNSNEIAQPVDTSYQIAPDEIGEPIENKEAANKRQALLDKLNKATKKQAGKFTNDTDARPLTVEQEKALFENSRNYLLIEGIDPLDLERVINNISSELIDATFNFETGVLDTKAIKQFFGGIKERIAAKKAEHEAIAREMAAFMAEDLVTDDVLDAKLEALDYLISANQALLDNFDLVNKYVLHDIASVSGVSLQDSSGFINLSTADVDTVEQSFIKSISAEDEKGINLIINNDVEDNEDANSDSPSDGEENEENEIDTEEERYSWNTVAKLKKSAKQSVSVKLKLFLRSLQKKEVFLDQDGKATFMPVTDDAFGFIERFNIDEVIDFLLPQLTNEFYTVDEMMAAIDDLAKDDLWLAPIAESLREAPRDMRRDFHRVFNKVVIKMKYVLVREGRGGEFIPLITEDNISETTKLVSRNWASKIKADNHLIQSKNGVFYFNVELAESWVKWAHYWRKKVSDNNLPPEGEFRDFLALFGIELHPSIFETIVTGKKAKSSRNASGLVIPKKAIGAKERIAITYKMQFNSDSYGLVTNLTKKLEDAMRSSKFSGDVRNFYTGTTVQELARQQAKRSPDLRSSSFFSGSSPIASHVDPYYIHKRMYDLKHGGIEKMVGAFNTTNYWLDAFSVNPNLLNQHDISLLSLSPFREFEKINFNRDYSQHNAVNKEIIKLAMFTSAIPSETTMAKEEGDESSKLFAGDTVAYFYPTLGSNSRTMTMYGPRHHFAIRPQSREIDNDVNQGTVSQEMIDFVYSYVFLSEAGRMVSNRTAPVEPLVRGSHVFYAIPELNTIPGLFDENHNFLSEGDQILVSPEKIQAVRDVIEDFLQKEIHNKMLSWEELGIIEYFGNSFITHKIADKYIKSIEKSLPKGAATNNLKVKTVAANYVVNNMLALHSMFGLYIGDPATFYKQSGENFNSDGTSKEFSDPSYNFAKDIDTTLQGIFKRLGTEIGPAAQQVAESESLNSEPMHVLVVNDDIGRLTKELIAYYKASGLSDDEIAAFSKSIKTDGVIFNHPLEHLASLWRFNKINESQYNEGLDYFKTHGTLPSNIPITTLKTRYLDQHQMSEHQIRVHLKGAEFYLSPELLDGSPMLKKIYEMMGGKDMKIHKVAFDSTVKTGKVSSFKLFNKDGTITKQTNFTTSVLKLTRGGLQLQTNTPNRENEKHAKASTQALKQIFLDIEKHFGPEMEKFHGHYNKIIEKKKAEFYAEIGYNDKSKRFKMAKFSAKLTEHIKRYTQDFNILSALEAVDTPAAKVERKRIKKELQRTDLTPDQRGILMENMANLKQRMKSPLWAAPSKNMLEPYVMSMVSSIIDDIKFRGSTYTLTTESYLGGQSEGITYTKAYDAEKGLQHYRFTDSGKTVHRSQVVMSWPFPDLEMGDFVGADGLIDFERLPKELLHIIGTRIPVSKQSSIHAMEIVGFLPHNYKGVVIAHSQFIAQTNWDFDDDKLFFYYPDYEVIGDTKNSETKYYHDDGSVSTQAVMIKENSDENEILKIMGKVLLSPKPEVRQVLHNRVTADLLKPAYDVFYDKFAKETNISFLSEAFYSKTYENQSNVDSMIGIAANLLNLHATIRQIPDGSRPLIRPANEKVQTIRIAGQKSGRFLGQDFDRLGTRISDNITALLQAAVDHANLGWLSVMNINSFTSSALTQAILEGFSVSTAFALINQDIVKEALVEKENLVREEGGVASRLNIITRLLQTYPNKAVSDILRHPTWSLSDKKNKIMGLYDFDNKDSLINSVTEEEYLNGGRLVKGKDGEAKLDENGKKQFIPFPNEDPIHWQTYIAFASLDDMGKKLSAYQKQINVDSKGYGKMLYMADQKMEAPFDLLREKEIENITQLLGDFHTINMASKSTKNLPGMKERLETLSPEQVLPDELKGKFQYIGTKEIKGDVHYIYIRPKTVYGISVVNGREAILNTLLNPEHKMYPYYSRAFSTLWKTIYDVGDFSQKPTYEVTKIKSYVFNETLAYLNSNIANNMYNGFLDERRAQLNIDRRETHSMADLLDLAKRDPYLADNPFLKKLTTIHNAKGGKSTLEYNGIQRDELSRNAVYSGFYDLLKLKTKTIPGTDMSVSEFTETLVESAFANGGIQHAKNYIKVIPADYLQVKGYYDFLYNLDLDDIGIFGHTNDGNKFNMPHFVSQFFRHYPEFIKPYRRGTNEVTFEEGEEITLGTHFVFDLPKQFKDRPPVFLSFLDKEGVNHLYQYRDSNKTYRRLELLKNYPDLQYDANTTNGYNRPTLPMDQFRRDYFSNESELTAVAREGAMNKEAIHDFYVKGKDIKGILAHIAAVSETKSNRDLAEFMLEVYSANVVQPIFKVQRNLGAKGSHKAGRNPGDPSIVKVDPLEIESAADYEITILHELMHPIIKEYVLDPLKISKDPNLRKNAKTLDSIYKMFLSRMEAEHGTKDWRVLGNKVPPEMKALANAAKNLQEFVAEATSNNVVKNYLNTTMWEGNTSMLKKIFAAVINILKNLGFNWKERLGDKVEQILLSQQDIILRSKMKDITRIQKEIERGNTYEVFWDLNKASVQYEFDKANLKYGSSVASEVVEDGDGFSTTIDNAKILNALMKKVPEVLIGNDFAEAVEIANQGTSKEGTYFDKIEQITKASIKKVVKAKSPIELFEKESELIEEYGPGRVVRNDASSNITILNEGYMYTPANMSEDYRPVAKNERIDTEGRTFTYQTEGAAQEQARRLERVYGYGRVSNVEEYAGEYVVEVYAAEDARSYFFNKKQQTPIRTRQRDFFSPEVKTEQDKIKDFINDKIKQLDRILVPLEKAQKRDPDARTLEKIEDLITQKLMFEESLEQFSSRKYNVDNIETFIEQRLAFLNEFIHEDNLLTQEMNEIVHELDWIQGVGDQSVKQEHFLFGKEWLTNRELRETYAGLANKAGDLAIEFHDKVLEKLAQEVNRRRVAGEEMVSSKDIEKMIIDVTPLTGQTTTIFGMSDHPLVELLGKLVNENGLKNAMAAKETHDMADKLSRAVIAKAANKKDPYDIYYERDSKGNVTNWLTHFFSYEYKKALQDMRNGGSGELNFKKVVLPWLKANTNYVDVRILFPTKEGDPYHYGGKEVTEEETAEYIRELKAEYGEYIFSRIYLDANNKVKEFQDNYVLEGSVPEDTGTVDIDSKLVKLEKFEKMFSPYVVAESLIDNEEGSQFDFKYVTQPPKRYIEKDGKIVESGWVNERFFKISSDPDLLAFYEFAYDKLTVINTLDREALGAVLGHRPINFLKKRFIESIANSNAKMATVLGHSYDTFMESIRGTEEPFQVHKRTDSQGNPIYEANDKVGDDRAEINKKKAALRLEFLVDIQKATSQAELIAALGKWGVKPDRVIERMDEIDEFLDNQVQAYDKKGEPIPMRTQADLLEEMILDTKQYPEIERTLREMATQEYFSHASKDLGTIIKYFNGLATTYKNAYSTESLINLAMHVFNQTDVTRLNGDGEPIEHADSSARYIKGAESQIRKALDYQLMVTMGWSRYNKGEVIKPLEKIYTLEEKKKKAELEQHIKNPNVDPDIKAALRVQIDSLGQPAYYNKLVDGLMKYTALIGLGWRVIAGQSNFLIGQATNLIESGSKRFFTDYAFKEASKMMRWSVLKNLTFNSYEHPTAKKIRGVMDTYGLLSDMTSEFYKSSNLSYGAKWYRWASPKQMTSRVEYVNQGQVVIAYLLSHKVSEFMPEYTGDESLWDALDETGKWNTAKFGEISDIQMSNIIGTIEDIKRIIMGPYNFNHTVQAKRVLAGRMLGAFHTWIPEAVRVRFGRERWDPFARVTTKGRWRTAGQLFTNSLKTNGVDAYSMMENLMFIMQNITKQAAYGQRFSEHDAANIRATMREVAMMLTLIIGRLVLKSMGDLGDDKKSNDTDNFIIYYLLNSGSRLLADLSFIFSFITSQDSQKGAVPLFKTTQNIYKFFVASFQVLGGDDEAGGNLYKSLMGFLPGATEIGNIEKFVSEENKYYLNAF